MKEFKNICTVEKLKTWCRLQNTFNS